MEIIEYCIFGDALNKLREFTFNNFQIFKNFVWAASISNFGIYFKALGVYRDFFIHPAKQIDYLRVPLACSSSPITIHVTNIIYNKPKMK